MEQERDTQLPPAPEQVTEAPEAATPAAEGSLTARRVLGLQATAGNAAVSRMLSGDGTLSRWTMPYLTLKSQEELIRDGIAGDTNAIGEITSFAAVSEPDRITMVGHLLDQVWVGPIDAGALERIWNSFGSFATVASANLDLWRRSTTRHSGLVDHVPEAKRIRDGFAGDVKRVAEDNLRSNAEYVHNEMERFGVPADEGAAMAEPTQHQAEETSRLQVAAEGLAKLQWAQEAAKEVFVGYAMERGDEFSRYWRRAKFEPGASPPLREIPPPEMGQSDYIYNDATESYVDMGGPHGEMDAQDYLAARQRVQALLEVKPYDEIAGHYADTDAAAAATLTRFPELYAISPEGASATQAFANADNPAAARTQLGAGFRRLQANITRTQQNLAAGDLDPLDLTPIHTRLLDGSVPGQPSGVAWTDPFAHAEAQDMVRGHNIDRALRQLLLQTVTEMAFVFAPVAGPAAIPLLLAGAAAAGGNLALDWSRYEALAAAQRSQAQPGTQLVEGRAVDEARMATEADGIAFAMAVLAVGAVAARAALDAIRSARAARELARRARLIEAAGAPTGVETWRPNEVPYTQPPDLQVVGPGRPLDVGALDPTKRYLWCIDAEGNILVAPEGQGELFPNRGRLRSPHPQAGETPIKHGDLVPGEGGAVRGTARAGGELSAEIGADGRPTGRWIMNNDSSYTFARSDQQRLGGANLNAAHDLLGTTGTDTSRIVPANTSGFDAPR